VSDHDKGGHHDQRRAQRNAGQQQSGHGQPPGERSHVIPTRPAPAGTTLAGIWAGRPADSPALTASAQRLTAGVQWVVAGGPDALGGQRHPAGKKPA
jgi:hypothetical protein